MPVSLDANNDGVEQDDYQHGHPEGERLHQPANEHTGHTLFQRGFISVHNVMEIHHITGATGGGWLCECGCVCLCVWVCGVMHSVCGVWCVYDWCVVCV